MGKFSGILFASDFDHTLSAMDNSVPPQNIEAIKYFTANGGIFTVASGRSIPKFRNKAALVPVNAPCILFNGGARFDYRTETLLEAHPMPAGMGELAKAILEFEPRAHVELQTVDAHYCLGPSATHDAALAHSGVRYTYITPGQEPPSCFKLAVYGFANEPPFLTPEQLATWDKSGYDRLYHHLKDLTAGKFEVVRSMPYIIELNPIGIHKGEAARRLAKDLGCARLVCAGDAQNDLAMLREADIAFCPADADAQVLSGGFTAVCPCGEGAIADAIARLEQLM